MVVPPQPNAEAPEPTLADDLIDGHAKWAL